MGSMKMPHTTDLSVARSRWRCLIAAVATIVAGLASRSESLGLVGVTGDYPGDALWALLVYLLLALAWPRWPCRKIAITAACFALTIELSQLYHAPWINEIRHTLLGGLVLGQGFLWSDLACYAVGITLGVLFDRWLIARDQ
jgi:hypothetical protein